jgi:hypothetical protein
MGILANGRHEQFAQLIAGGATIIGAYEKCGYPRNRSNACRLRLRNGVRARIDELKSQKTAAVELETLSAAEKAGVDAFWVLRGLRRNAIVAARRGDTAGSNRALEIIAKHLGLLADKKQIEVSFIDDSDAYLQGLRDLVHGKVIDNEPAAIGSNAADNDGFKYGSDDSGK